MSQIKAIILAGSRDFGRCPIASHLPAALWPVLDKPVLERLLQNLSSHGIEHAVICSNGDTALLQKNITFPDFMQVTFLIEELPVGSAGCIRDAVTCDTDTVLVVLNAAMISPPDINRLVQEHRAGKCELTVAFEPDFDDATSNGRAAEIYICESSIVRYIPARGYCDLKENLIPILHHAGKSVCAAKLAKSTGSFRDYASYLTAIAEYLENCGSVCENSGLKKLGDSGRIWLANNAKINMRVSIFGPVVVMDNAVISEDAIIFGPAVIGRNATIDKGTLVDNCVLWDGASVGKNCHVSNSLVGYDSMVTNGQIIENTVVASLETNYLITHVGNAVFSADGSQVAADIVFKRLGGKAALWALAIIFTVVLAIILLT